MPGYRPMPNVARIVPFGSSPQSPVNRQAEERRRKARKNEERREYASLWLEFGAQPGGNR